MGFNEVLIECVREHPCLYDSTCKEFKDKEKKENAWEEISLKTLQPARVCATRWTSLRDKFTKEKKKMDVLNRNESSSFISTTWEHYDSMVFLKDYIKHRMTANSYFHQDSLPIEAEASIQLIDDDDDDADNGGNNVDNNDNNEVMIDEEEICSNRARKSPVCKSCEVAVAESLNKTQRKRKRIYTNEKIRHANYEVPFELSRNHRTGLCNQYQAFGAMVAARLQSVSPENAEVMMATISSCLFGSF